MGSFIAGDWGTSHLRLTLCDADGHALETETGPGVSTLGGKLAETFETLTRRWDATLPVMLCGMAGSTLGWREVPYLPCPADPRRIASGAVRFEASGRRIAIAPGLSCNNVLGAPDVMRGEETQILGTLRARPSFAEGAHLLCLPGTHTKWAVLKSGRIETFVTGVSGELYDILARHSVLAGKQADAPHSADAFDKGIAQPEASLIHLLFQTRSRQLAGDIRPDEAASFLSGLVIGQDVSGALKLFPQDKPVILIGAPHLTTLYAAALRAHDVTSEIIDGAQASLSGLTALHDALELAHAS
ncbi:MAG TPA: 2-dehydro-3-deoxygalactonokinase [Rhizomicrobium sp.]|jgi:2-dehydro-3-deoxygalactonokinase